MAYTLGNKCAKNLQLIIENVVTCFLEHSVHLVSILTTAVDMSFCTSLQNFIQIGPPSAEKKIDVMSIFKMADLSHLGF